MQEHSVLTLLGISGVAATFAGFSGVVAAFDRRAHGNWHPEERFRLINMVVIALSTCLLALTPLTEESLGLSESALWMTASILMGAFCVVYVSVSMRKLLLEVVMALKITMAISESIAGDSLQFI